MEESRDEWQRTHVARIGADRQGTRATVRPERHRDLYARASQLLKRSRAERLVETFTDDAVLGIGGMSVVRRGRQQNVGRDVAIKRAQQITDAKVQELRLLQEAWIVGALEHPNIVPVYAMELDAHDSPLVVLKLIDGENWKDLSSDRESIERRFGFRDPLSWNLQVLVQVCNAVEFAHDRGIVHRDLKLENVMIGSFGEVYVIDWGVALSLRPDPDGRLPTAETEQGLAGTPCFMAPEMLSENPSRISERTDIYLLGGMLYEVLTGRPPHPEGAFSDIVASIASSPPRLPADVPPELAAIVTRAMAFAPEDRIPSVSELRKALVTFSQHERSRELGEIGERKLRELERAIAGATLRTADPEIDTLYSECCFAFREAKEAWRDNAAAQAGIERASILLAGRRLEQNRVKECTEILRLVPTLPDELRAKLDLAIARSREKRELINELAAMGKNRDPDIGARTRIILTFLVAGLWVLVSLVPVFDETVREDRVFPFTSPSFALIAIACVLLVASRKSSGILRTSLNRQILRTVVAVSVAQLALHAFGVIAAIPLSHVRVIELLLDTSFAMMFASSFERRLWPIPIGYGLAFLVAISEPDALLVAMVAAKVVTLATSLVVWWPARWRGGPSEPPPPSITTRVDDLLDRD